MHRRLNDLNSCIVTNFDRSVGGKGDLRKAECARVGIFRGTDDLDAIDHDIGHVWRDRSKAHVEVYEGSAVASKPAWLEGDCATLDGPFGAVRRSGHTSA